ncbi:hypothetical protein ADK76_37930 [Streptomyces griseoflavus]|uniref:hypothetical protein n=1 Tax=Streptomyces rimosus TaxID=1927 RepID=UPI0004C4ECC6|nr:hypothetical protein [Streptomyces rimosus]KOG51003.1 hypothetical protein ADK76_37930 [Streptomyces griseoflavus]
MAHVRGHYRRNGSYVRPHYRRTKGSSRIAPSSRSSTSRRIRTTSPTPPGATTHVRSHYRNGSHVRAHRRRLGPGATAAAGGGIALLLILLIAVLGGGGGAEETPGQHPTPSVSAHVGKPAR